MAWRDRLRFWAWPSELRRRGVLGINQRNLRLVSALNSRALYKRVDDKSRTKAICEAHQVPVPQTYALIRRFGDIRHLERILGGRQQFVIKPACGSGGRGVLVVQAREGTVFHTLTGQQLSLSYVRYYLSAILSGLYSLGGQSDKAIVEERITRHPVLKDLAVGGTPDIRIIVCRGQPLMAMLRLPTRESSGRANLHQGAIGVGIDMATGRTTNATHHNRSVSRHPDTGAAVGGLEIPCWAESLITATSLSRALEMGYIGVDIVLDARRGPIVLEANARPGLAIQIANGAGLLERCRQAAAAISTAAWPPNSHPRAGHYDAVAGPGRSRA
jgi:alpha-L-glutamate ligase-like protein